MGRNCFHLPGSRLDGPRLWRTALEETLNKLREQGFQRFYLWMLQGNQRCRRFYARHGFKVTSDTIAYKIGGQDIQDVRYVRVEK